MSESTTNSLCWHRLTSVLYLWIIDARVHSRTKYVNKYLLAVCNCILPCENIQLIIIIIIIIAIVGHRKQTLKFGQNWVNDKQCIVVVVAIVLVLLLLLIQKPRNQALKLGPNQVIYSGDLLLLFDIR